MNWGRLFFDPIELSDGRVLRSLRDAGEFIQSLPSFRVAPSRGSRLQDLCCLVEIVAHDITPSAASSWAGLAGCA
jgi:hypothetical protein